MPRICFGSTALSGHGRLHLTRLPASAALSPRHKTEALTPAQQRLLSGSQADEGARVQSGTSSPGHPAQTRRQLLTGATAGVTGACICGCCGPTPVARAIEQWDYRRSGGSWGGTCGAGEYQSPIDFKFTTNEPQMFFASSAGDTGKSRMTNAYKRVAPRFTETPGCVVTNAGHGTMQVNFPTGACQTMIDGKMRNLLQFHFHAPSEHTLNGRRFSMEAHLVHKEPESGEFSVLGVMIARNSDAPSNPALRAALDKAPAPTQKTNNITFDPNHLLPNSVRDGRPSFIHYTGSLTTPPCTEGIKWYVYTDPLYINDEEVLDFIDFVGGGKPDFNARPIQVLSDREWSYFLDSCNCQLTYRGASSGGGAA